MTRSNRNERGFTLVEVSIILSVVALLSAVMAPVIGGVLDRARLSAAEADLVAISLALAEFLEDIGCTFVPQNSGYDSGWRRVNSVEAPAVAPPNAPPSASGRGRRMCPECRGNWMSAASWATADRIG